MLLARALPLALLAPTTGCPGPTCKVTPADVETMLVVAGSDGAIVEIHDGTQVPLVAAPQGGHIILVGAKVRGADACMIDATGALRDPATGRVIGLDERPLVLESIGGGWAQPEAPALSSMPNVAVCPTAATTTSIDGNPFTLELTLVAASTTIATLSATVTPSCGGDTSCHSECTL